MQLQLQLENAKAAADKPLQDDDVTKIGRNSAKVGDSAASIGRHEPRMCAESPVPADKIGCSKCRYSKKGCSTCVRTEDMHMAEEPRMCAKSPVPADKTGCSKCRYSKKGCSTCVGTEAGRMAEKTETPKKGRARREDTRREQPTTKVGKAAAPSAHLVLQQLPTGTLVVVQNLVAKPEYNGRHARVISFDDTQGRYLVALVDGKKASLKPETVARALSDSRDTPGQQPGPSESQSKAASSKVAARRATAAAVRERRAREDEQQRRFSAGTNPGEAAGCRSTDADESATATFAEEDVGVIRPRCASLLRGKRKGASDAESEAIDKSASKVTDHAEQMLHREAEKGTQAEEEPLLVPKGLAATLGSCAQKARADPAAETLARERTRKRRVTDDDDNDDDKPIRREAEKRRKVQEDRPSAFKARSRAATQRSTQHSAAGGVVDPTAGDMDPLRVLADVRVDADSEWQPAEVEWCGTWRSGAVVKPAYDDSTAWIAKWKERRGFSLSRHSGSEIRLESNLSPRAVQNNEARERKRDSVNAKELNVRADAGTCPGTSIAGSGSSARKRKLVNWKRGTCAVCQSNDVLTTAHPHLQQLDMQACRASWRTADRVRWLSFGPGASGTVLQACKECHAILDVPEPLWTKDDRGKCPTF